jgi:hypothetical protein
MIQSYVVLGDHGFVQILFFSDSVIESFVSIALSLPAPPLCSVLPSVVSVERGNRLEPYILLKNCQAKGNSTLFFSCVGALQRRFDLPSCVHDKFRFGQKTMMFYLFWKMNAQNSEFICKRWRQQIHVYNIIEN